MFGMSRGLNLDNLEVTTREEIDAYLADVRWSRVPLYEMTANSVWLENRPDFCKLHRRGTTLFDDPDRHQAMVMSFANLHSYIHLGWEVGILNEFRVLQSQGVTKAQLMEVVMTAQITSGMRGLECVYRAVGQILRDFQDRPAPATFPEGWAADMDAFHAGIDLSTAELTPSDLKGIEAWYERTIGFVPGWVRLTASYHPRMLKAVRAKWENAFQGALPKQVMPYLMLRHSTCMNHQDGIREAALLGKAWGLTRDWVVNAVMWSAFYFTGMDVLSDNRGLAAALEDWDK
jgi:hypothetical protein